MNRSRLVLACLGLVAFALALLTAAPSVRSAISIESLVAFVGSDYFFVAIFAVLALAIGLGSVVSGRESALHQAEMPVPERPFESATPGDEFDAAACTWRASVPVLGWHRREGVRERLRETAAETIARTENCSIDEAARRVREGTWTDDPWAAAFLGERSIPLTERLAALADLDPWFVRGARRSAAAVVTLSEAQSGSNGAATTIVESPSRHAVSEVKEADGGENVDPTGPGTGTHADGQSSGDGSVAGDPERVRRETNPATEGRRVNTGSDGND